MVRPGLLAAALLIAGCAAKISPPAMLPVADPPLTSLTGIAPGEIAGVAMFNNSCPVPYKDDDGSLIVTSCGRFSVQRHCPLKGSDARFVVAAMRRVIPNDTGYMIQGPRFYLSIQLRNGRMFTATIPAEPFVGNEWAPIRAGGVASAISTTHLSRLQAIAGRAGCLNAPGFHGSVT